MSEYQQALAQLRTAAETREWTVLQDTLTRLLMEIDFFYGVEIAVTRAHNHLTVFETAHPDAGWARSLLVWITSYGAAPANLPPQAGTPHNSPGAGNYIAGLIDLTRAMERMTPLDNRVRFLANAISNTILAELAAAWYGDYPEAWEAQQEHGDEIDETTGVSVRQTIQAEFWLDEDTAERDTAAWLDMAAAIERKLR